MTAIANIGALFSFNLYSVRFQICHLMAYCAKIFSVASHASVDHIWIVRILKILAFFMPRAFKAIHIFKRKFTVARQVTSSL